MTGVLKSAGHAVGTRSALARDHLPDLLDKIRERGYQLVGPTVRNGAIVCDEISSVADLPEGWTDEQDGGVYRLRRRDDRALFAHAAGPQSWKKFLFPPALRLWEAQRKGAKFTVTKDTEPDPPKYAFIGIRPCDLAAMSVQDKVFLHGNYTEPLYGGRRTRLFIVAVNCTYTGGTCFCTSMGTGPGINRGYDLALTEVIDADRHYFIVDIGTNRGSEVMAQVPHAPATADEEEHASRAIDAASRRMGRLLDTSDIKDLLYRNSDSPRWEAIAERCLSCGNCTLVCPTCFCHNVEDSTNLPGDTAQRMRYWDSCFTLGFSYIHGGSVRYSVAARYRQWLTHKFASWIDQFGTSGCVGCGRCITWCPVAIDVTQEIKAIRETDRTGKEL